MATRSYRDDLRRDFGELIDLLVLTDLQKRFLRGRWLDQVVWTEGRAGREQRRYYALRVVAIVGGVLIPALVSLNVDGTAAAAVRWATFGLGLVVATAVALEGFFRFGERWRHYRRTAELLKSEGWQYFQLTGKYQGKDHAGSFPLFADRVELVVQQDVDGFVSTIAVEKTDAGAGKVGAPPAPSTGAPPSAPRPPAPPAPAPPRPPAPAGGVAKAPGPVTPPRPGPGPVRPTGPVQSPGPAPGPARPPGRVQPLPPSPTPSPPPGPGVPPARP